MSESEMAEKKKGVISRIFWKSWGEKKETWVLASGEFAFRSVVYLLFPCGFYFQNHPILWSNLQKSLYPYFCQQLRSPILIDLLNSDRSFEFCREAIRTIYRVINSESTWSSKAKTPKMRRETRSSIWVSYFCCQNDATLAEVAVR